MGGSLACRDGRFEKVKEIKTYGINECACVDEYSVKSDGTHGLEWVAVDDVTRDYGIAHLNTSGKNEEGNLAYYPVVGLVDADSPQDQTN